MNFVTQVSTLVIKDDRVLMINESKEKAEGQWNLPGGQIRLREKVLDAAVRETFEETGKEFIPESIIGIYTSCGEDHYFHFVVKGSVNEEQASESPEDLVLQWISLSEVTSFKLRNPSRIERIIDDYLSGIHLPLTLIKEDIDS